MNTQWQQHRFLNKATRRASLFLLIAVLVLPGPAVSDDEAAAPESAETVEQTAPHTPVHMSEALRAPIRKVVVLPTASPGKKSLTGSYEKDTLGLVEGMAVGTGVGRISKDIAGIPVSFPIRVLQVPGAIVGGLFGATQREIQDFRDGLSRRLADAANQPLSNDALASDVFWNIRSLKGLDAKVFAPSTPIPADTDVVLYVNLNDVMINIDGKDAIITTRATADLRRMSDGEHVYEKEVLYQDRDTLKNWTRNDSALWQDYTNFARHYIGREVSAQVFERVELNHELTPKDTDTIARVKKNLWQGVTRTLTPTLAWELKLLGGDNYGAWADRINATDVFYDLEVYDNHQLVYAAKRVAGTSHTIDMPLEACKNYRWSVRPSYRVDSGVRFGEWMRLDAERKTAHGGIGRQVSASPAYIQDFAALKVHCRSK